MVSGLDEWQWSSFPYFVQLISAPSWLQVDWTLALFGAHRQTAIEAYRAFVVAGVGLDNPMKQARHQLLLGDDAFVARHRSPHLCDSLNEVIKTQRRVVALSLLEYQIRYPDRDRAIAAAYYSTAYTMTQIASHFKISYRTVSRVVRKVRMAELVCDWQN